MERGTHEAMVGEMALDTKKNMCLYDYFQSSILQAIHYVITFRIVIYPLFVICHHKKSVVHNTVAYILYPISHQLAQYRHT